MKQFLFSSVLIGALVYSIMVAWLYFYQSNLLYFPDTSKPAPAVAGFPDMEVVGFAASDGLEIYGWYKPAAPGKATIVYFHGNAGNLLNHSWIARPLIEAGYGVLLVEYRGFGGNPGAPSEAGLKADGRGATEFLKGLGIPEGDLVFFGMSLGTGIAVALAAEYSPHALVLQSPYTSIAAAGQHHYWYMPVKFLIKDRFDSLAPIQQVTVPVLVVYAEGDRIIPPDLSVALFDAANEPKTLKMIENTGHNDLADEGGIDAVLEFLGTL